MRRAAQAVLIALIGIGSPLIVAVNAQAASAQAASAAASLTMHSDQGDFLGQGKDYSYQQPQDQFFANSGFNQATVFGTVDGLNGDTWTLDFAAPDNQPLQVGDYPNAQAFPFQQPGSPGIEVNEGFTCQTITGEFDVRDLEYTNGLISRLDITFKEHCNGAAAALTGELIFVPPPPEPPLSLTVKVSRTAKLDKTDALIEATGTVTCTQFVWATADIDITQDHGVDLAVGFVSVSCSPGTPAHWTIFAGANGSFHPGAAQGSAFASGQDAIGGTIANSPTVNTVMALTPAHL